MTVPSLDDLLTGRVAISAIRKVELEDLLGRDRVRSRRSRLVIGLLEDKTVLVTQAPAVPSARSCAGRSRASGRACWSLSNSRSSRSTASNRNSPGSRWPAWWAT
jgi:hypothetical protein